MIFPGEISSGRERRRAGPQSVESLIAGLVVAGSAVAVGKALGASDVVAGIVATVTGIVVDQAARKTLR